MTTPPFAWSWSRHRTFEHCRRKYWYDYYGSRGGWRTSASPETRELYVLKRLQTRSQWLGIRVHELGEHVLKQCVAGQAVDDEMVVADAMRVAARQIEDARRGRHRLVPKECAGFVELEFGADPGDASWEETLEDTREQMNALLNHPLMRRLRSVPERILEVEELKRVWIAGMPVWVSLDALVRDGRGGAVVVDWKTGRRHQDATVGQQLAIYCTYVQKRYGLAIHRVSGVHGLTRTGEFRRHHFDEQDLARVRAQIGTSMRAMWDLLPDRRRNSAEKADFEMLDVGSSACASCRYRRVCGRE